MQAHALQNTTKLSVLAQHPFFPKYFINLLKPKINLGDRPARFWPLQWTPENILDLENAARLTVATSPYHSIILRLAPAVFPCLASVRKASNNTPDF